MSSGYYQEKDIKDSGGDISVVPVSDAENWERHNHAGMLRQSSEADRNKGATTS